MVYKWLGPFNEMYIKMREQHKKKKEEIILIELFEDLFGETYRTDSPQKRKRKPGSSMPYLSEGSFIDIEDFNERMNK